MGNVDDAKIDRNDFYHGSVSIVAVCRKSYGFFGNTVRKLNKRALRIYA
jgi:hypothetical protein